MLFTTAWEIWNARNRLNWDNKLSTVDDIWRRAAGIASDFLAASLRVQAPERVLTAPLAGRWRPSVQDNCKLNVSTFVDKKSKSVGIGIVICDAQCHVLAALQKKEETRASKTQMQAQAILTAVQFAFDMGFRRLEVDILYKELIPWLQANELCLAPIGPLIEDILWVKNACDFCHFSFINSSCNKAASVLASEAASSISPQVWLENCPACIVSIVLSDSP